jgi:hypothetical protein
MKIAHIGLAKAVAIEIAGNEHYLLYNGAAMFTINDKYGESEFWKKMSENNADGLKTLIDVTVILAEQGELARRDIKLEPRKIITKKEIGSPVTMTPKRIFVLRQGCLDAINLGWEQEVPEDTEEIDLGLLELQKKRN